jgi:hypothetical protein
MHGLVEHIDLDACGDVLAGRIAATYNASGFTATEG